MQRDDVQVQLKEFEPLSRITLARARNKIKAERGTRPPDVEFSGAPSMFTVIGDGLGRKTPHQFRRAGLLDWPVTYTTRTDAESIREALVGSGSRFVLLFGQEALDLWRPELDVRKVHGNVLIWDEGYVLFPVRDDLEHLTKYDLTTWKGIVTEEIAALWCLGDICSEATCGGWVDRYDDMGVPYCAYH